jgi:hypothetical protein
MPPKPPAALRRFGQEHPSSLGKSGVASSLGDQISKLAHNRYLFFAVSPDDKQRHRYGTSKNIRQDPIRVRLLLLTPISSQAVISAT